MTADVRTQQRRKVGLELLSLVVPLTAAVLFSSWYVVGWPRPVGALVAAATAVVLVVGWLWHRSHHAPSLEEWNDGPTGLEPDPVDDLDHDLDLDHDGNGGVGSTLAALAIVGVIAVVAVTTRFLLPLLVIGLFAIAGSGSDLGDVLLATACTLAVGLLVELGLVEPLARRWGLSVDEPVLTRSGPPASST